MFTKDIGLMYFDNYFLRSVILYIPNLTYKMIFLRGFVLKTNKIPLAFLTYDILL